MTSEINELTELTKEQREKIPEYIEKYKNIQASTTPSNRAAAEKAFIEAYQILNKKSIPTFIWVDSPFVGAKVAAQLEKGDINVTPEEIAAQTVHASFGSFEAYWVGFYAFITEQLPVQHDGTINLVKTIVEECGPYWAFEDVVVISEKPTKVVVKNDKLHCEDGMALVFKDGTGAFACEGERCTSLLDVHVKLAEKKEKN